MRNIFNFVNTDSIYLFYWKKVKENLQAIEKKAKDTYDFHNYAILKLNIK
jgi:hypothetical protein